MSSQVNVKHVGEEDLPDGPKAERRTLKFYLWRPVVRFCGWWGGMFAFLCAFSVCPICGQPGCVGGPATAGFLGGAFAILISLIRPSRWRRKARACKHQDAPAEHAPKEQAR